jgi:hypothetical protein
VIVQIAQLEIKGAMQFAQFAWTPHNPPNVGERGDGWYPDSSHAAEQAKPAQVFRINLSLCQLRMGIALCASATQGSPGGPKGSLSRAQTLQDLRVPMAILLRRREAGWETPL